MNKRSRKRKRILVFLLMVSVLLPMFAPVSVEAAEELYLAYQNTEQGVPVVKLKAKARKDYRVDELSMNIGESADLCFINATFWKNPVWTSSDTSVATVDTSGVITAVGAGTTEITLTYTKKITGRKVSASATVYVSDTYMLMNVASGMYLTVKNNTNKNGEEVNLTKLNEIDSSAQKFVLEYQDKEKNIIRLSPEQMNKMYLDVRVNGEMFALGKTICIWSDDDDPNKNKDKELILERQPDGSYYLTFAEHLGYCIGAESLEASKSGATLEVCRKDGGAEQRWILCNENGTPVVNHMTNYQVGLQYERLSESAHQVMIVYEDSVSGKKEIGNTFGETHTFDNGICRYCQAERESFTDAQLQKRMYELVGRLLKANIEAHGNSDEITAYFTTTGQALKSDDDTGCFNVEIMRQDWFNNEFKDEFNNPVLVSNFPEHLPSIGRDDENRGYSCFGFACFAQWYIYKSSNTEKVTARKEHVGTFTKDFLTKNLKVGDIIRIYITKDGNSYYHSMIFHSFTENGIMVLDSNLAKTNKVCIEEISYNRSGWRGDKVYIYRVDNISSVVGTMNVGNGVTISEGTQYSFKNAASGWHMNVKGAGKINGTHVNLWPLDMSEPNTQCYTFSIVSPKERTVMISPICAPYLCLDARHGGNPLAPAQKICVWGADGDTSKEIVIEMLEDGSCYLTFKDNKEYCIGAASAIAAQTKQTQLVICKKSGAPEQRWFLCDENGTPLVQQKR